MHAIQMSIERVFCVKYFCITENTSKSLHFYCLFTFANGYVIFECSIAGECFSTAWAFYWLKMRFNVGISLGDSFKGLVTYIACDFRNFIVAICTQRICFK